MAKVLVRCGNSSCGAEEMVDEQYVGRTAKCRKCGASFRVQPVSEGNGSAASVNAPECSGPCTSATPTTVSNVADTGSMVEQPLSSDVTPPGMNSAHQPASSALTPDEERKDESPLTLQWLAEDVRRLLAFLALRRWRALIKALERASGGDKDAFQRAVGLWRIPRSADRLILMAEALSGHRTLDTSAQDAASRDLWQRFAREQFVRLVSDQSPRRKHMRSLQVIPEIALRAERCDVRKSIAWLYRIPLIWIGSYPVVAAVHWIDTHVTWFPGILLLPVGLPALAVEYLGGPATLVAIAYFGYRLTKQLPKYRRFQPALASKDPARLRREDLFCEGDGNYMVSQTTKPDLWTEPPLQYSCASCDRAESDAKRADVTFRRGQRLFRCFECGHIFCDLHWAGSSVVDEASGRTVSEPDPRCPSCGSRIWLGEQVADACGMFEHGVLLTVRDWNESPSPASPAGMSYYELTVTAADYADEIREAGHEMVRRHGLGRGERLNESQRVEFERLCRDNGVPTSAPWFNLIEPVFVLGYSTAWLQSEAAESGITRADIDDGVPLIPPELASLWLGDSD